MAAITSDGSDIVFKKIETNREWIVKLDSLEEVFELKRVICWINDNEFKKVGLQFPNELLSIASHIYNYMLHNTKAFCPILGDTSFSSCCVDEIAGERLGINAIVHFGKACLSESVGRLPFIHSFGKQTIDETVITCAVNQLISYRENNSQCIVIFYDFRYREVALHMASLLPQPNILSFPKNHLDEGNEPVLELAGRVFLNKFDPKESLMFYIGKPELSLYRICVSTDFKASNCYCLDTVNLKLIPVNNSISTFLSRRIYLIERAKAAKRVGTLSCKNYDSLIQRLRNLLKISGKAYTTIHVGRLNAAKLMNVSEIDVYVLVACPESSLLDSREFMNPVISPFEMECALASTAEYPPVEDPSFQKILQNRTYYGNKLHPDFKDLLVDGCSYVDENVFKLASYAEVSHSLLTGSIEQVDFSLSNELEFDDNNQIVERSEANWQLAQIIDWKNRNRTWYGLDPQLDKTEVPSGIEIGRSGIPISYKNEQMPKTSD